jgi:FkbM family methyltransferase
MSKFDLALSHTLRDWWQFFWIRYRFKYVLPRTNFAVIDGIRLDISSFSPRIRNRILMGYEEPEKKICQEFLRPGDSVLELGGAIGFIGLFCQKKLGIRDYISVEANPRTVEILKRNYDLNGIVPIVWNIAVGEAKGTVSFDVGGDFWEHSISSTQHPQTESVTVPCAQAEAIISQAAAANVLIIDVEGAERFINFATLPDRINKIIIELHPAVIGKKGAGQIVSTLCQKGFRTVCEEGNTIAFLKNI